MKGTVKKQTPQQPTYKHWIQPNTNIQALNTVKYYIHTTYQFDDQIQFRITQKSHLIMIACILRFTFEKNTPLGDRKNSQELFSPSTFNVLSAADVTISGSDGKHCIPDTAVPCASLIWLHNFLFSKSHNPIWPLALPVAIMGWPSATKVTLASQHYQL